MSECRVYIIINTDLNMSKGKCCSQAAHAMSSLQLKMLNVGSDLFTNWASAQSPVIILKGTTLQYGVLKQYYISNKILFSVVRDAGLTEVPCNTETTMSAVLYKCNDIKYIHKYSLL